MPLSVYSKHRRLVSRIRELLDEIEQTLNIANPRPSRAAAKSLADCEIPMQEAVRALLLANVALRSAVGMSEAQSSD